MNAVNRFLYWEMNYHVEHHMFPLVPYRNLGRLHQLVTRPGTGRQLRFNVRISTPPHGKDCGSLDSP